MKKKKRSSVDAFADFVLLHDCGSLTVAATVDAVDLVGVFGGKRSAIDAFLNSLVVADDEGGDDF